MNKENPMNQGMNNQNPMNQGMNNQNPMNQGMNNQNSMNQGMNNQNPMNQGMNNQNPMNQGMNNQNPMNQGYTTNYNVGNSNNKNYTTLIIVIVGVVTIGAFIFLFLGSKNIKNKEDNTSNNQVVDLGKLEKNINVEGIRTQTGEIILKATNNNSTNVLIAVNIKIYDKNNELIDVKDNALIFAEKNSNAYSNVYFEEEYNRIEISFKAKEDKMIEYIDDKDYDVTYSKKDDKLLVQVKNKTKNNIQSIGLYFLFYKNNKLIASRPLRIFDLRANEEITKKLYIPMNQNYDKIDYDKIVIDKSAYNYKD